MSFMKIKRWCVVIGADIATYLLCITLFDFNNRYIAIVCLNSSMMKVARTVGFEISIHQIKPRQTEYIETLYVYNDHLHMIRDDVAGRRNAHYVYTGGN